MEQGEGWEMGALRRWWDPRASPNTLPLSPGEEKLSLAQLCQTVHHPCRGPGGKCCLNDNSATAMLLSPPHQYPNKYPRLMYVNFALLCR